MERAGAQKARGAFAAGAAGRMRPPSLPRPSNKETGMILKILQNEAFYGGAVTEGANQPYTAASVARLDLTFNRTPNQTMPLLLSTAGRWLWNPKGMEVEFCGGVLRCSDDTRVGAVAGGLGAAYRDALKHCFCWHDIRLDSRLFAEPVYNTWIELTFYQSQEKVLRYARDIRAHGLPAGVLMIDDGWSDHYGRWRFSHENFHDPAQMLTELHRLGFSVMLWVCPFITPDTLEYRELEQAGLLVKDASGQPHIAHWWNGWSAVLDMTLPAACAWLKGQLDALQELGVDGFKFDAGDSIYYPAGGAVSGDDHSRAWAAFGEGYALNEYRVTAGAGGWSLMQRQCDKEHSWGGTGLGALVPGAIVQSLTGHPFLCPDMIGGGEYRNFCAQENLDQELFVRWAQIACLMPVMQFSAAPWRVLSAHNYEKVLRAVALRQRYAPYLARVLQECRATGEPMLRPLAYDFSDPAYTAVTDQFMVGGDLMVAPFCERGQTRREVLLPPGRWRREEGGLLENEGPARLTVSCEGPAVFERV